MPAANVRAIAPPVKTGGTACRPEIRLLALHHVRVAERRAAGTSPGRYGRHTPAFALLGLRPQDYYEPVASGPVGARPVSPRPSSSPDRRAVSFSTAVRRAAKRPELVRISVASPMPTVAPTATTETMIAIVPLSMNSSLADRPPWFRNDGALRAAMQATGRHLRPTVANCRTGRGRRCGAGPRWGPRRCGGCAFRDTSARTAGPW